MERARAVRAHVLTGLAGAVPLFGVSRALLGEAFWRNPVLVGIWVSALVLMIRPFARPLDHTAVLRRRRLPDVLEAGGLPAGPGGDALTPGDRRLALLDPMDELGPPRTGIFAGPAGRREGSGSSTLREAPAASSRDCAPALKPGRCWGTSRWAPS